MSSQQVLDALFRQDFPSFAEKVFCTLNPGKGFKPNWHLEAIAHQLDRVRSGDEKKLIINAPPRSGKSTLASVAFPAFLMGHDPGARFICVSHSEPLATKLARDFRRISEEDWYHRIVPGVDRTKGTEEMFETTRGGARLSTSIGASVTELGGGYIIIDDPIKPDEAFSEAARALHPLPQGDAVQSARQQGLRPHHPRHAAPA
jgi:hypothetical protein